MPDDPPAAPSRPGVGGLAQSEIVSDLYRKHSLGLTRLAYLVLGDREAAEDIVQEVYSQLFQRYGNLEDPGKALPYLRSAVLNRSRSWLRRLRVARRHTTRSEARVSASESVDERESMLTALATLPRRQREVLILRYYADLDDSEIAATLRIAASTVRSTAARALAAVGRNLEEPHA